VRQRGQWLYNFWQDAQNPRGIWRRTTLEEFRKKDPAWETVLDIGKLGADENKNWVWKGSTCLFPDYQRCLISLSRGGADAVETREFDIPSKTFVKDGFLAPESKGGVDWKDKDTIYIAQDFGPGTMTTSGYPRIVKEWKRGTPLSAAKVIYEGKETDVGVGSAVTNEKDRSYERVTRSIDFWSREQLLRVGDRWVLVDVPKDARAAFWKGMIFVNPKSDWKPAGTTYKAGSLIAANLDGFLAGKRDFEVVFEPRERVALHGYTATKNHLVLDILDNVKSRIVEVTRNDGKWVSRNVPVPEAASIGRGSGRLQRQRRLLDDGHQLHRADDALLREARPRPSARR
jgi:prolyl oligopeptidase